MLFMKLSCGSFAAGFLLTGVLASQCPNQCPPDIDEAGSWSTVLEKARLLQDVGCRRASQDLAEKLLERVGALYGPSSREAADVLDVLAENHFWLGERNELAVSRARKALRIRRDDPGGGRADLARSHLDLGALLASQLDAAELVEEAFGHYEEARRLWQEELGAESREAADLLTWIAELVDDWGRQGRVRARQLPWVRDLFDEETAPGRSVRDVLVSFGGTPSDARARLQEDPALAVSLRSVALARAAGDAATYAECLNTLGNLLLRRQLYDVALPVFGESLDVRRSSLPPGHPQIARAYHNRGEVRMLVGELEGARADLEQAYEMRLALGNQAALASTLHQLGKLLYFTGDLREAVELYKEALPHLRESNSASHWRYAESEMSLAETYEELSQTEEAERRYRIALRQMEDSVSPEAARTETARARLGHLLVGKGDIDGGRRLLEQARAALQPSGASPRGEDQPLSQQHRHAYALTLNGLADVAREEHDDELALELRRDAAELLGSHPDQIDTLLAQAETELDLDRIPDAVRTLERLAELVPRLGDDAYAAQARSELLHARLAFGEGGDDEALTRATRAAQLFIRDLAPAFRILPPDKALRYSLRSQESLDLALDLLRRTAPSPESVARVWETLALNRGQVIDELERRYGWAQQTADPQIRAYLARLDEARRHLAATQVRSRYVATAEERAVLLRYAAARVRTAELDLAEKIGPFRPGGPGAPSGLDDELRELPEGSVLVAFVRFRASGVTERPEAYGAFIASRAEPGQHFVDLGPAVEIDGRIRAWRAALFDDPWQGDDSRLRPSGVALRRALWDPLARYVAGARRVFVVPDGSIFLVPFAALPGRTAGSYLIEEGFEIHRLVAERDLLRHLPRPPQTRRLLAIGGPDFDAGGIRVASAVPESAPSLFDRVRATRELFTRFLRDPCLGQSSLHFFALPEAEKEVADVVSIFGGGHTRLSNADATETAFKRLASEHSVIHVATHGFFDLECRDRSASRGLAIPSLEVPEEQGFVSGLAFAGANRRHDPLDGEDDGLLTVPEIASLDLSGVEWVVLSACETGLGEIATGEGLLGLSRAFRVAGARTLILSLWPVDDHATREWMNELYRARFQRGEPTASSLRSASLAILEKRRRSGASAHPFFWAAFVAMGGWD